MNIERILSKLGIASLSEMQVNVGKTMLDNNHDIVVLSPTGTGKTLAYLLPLIQLINSTDDNVQGVVIVPGRELALQSATVMSGMGCGLRCMPCYGGRMTMEEHLAMRKIRPQIIFATPGRLNDHLDKGNIDASTIKYLVIDEFDKCLEMGFADEMSALIQKLHNVKKKVLLSATDAEAIPDFVNTDGMVRLDYLSAADTVKERVSTYRVTSPEKDKLHTLDQLLRLCGDGSTIVFVNYRDSVERVSGFLKEEGFSLSSYHGGLEQKERESALYRFENGSANILVSTDLASRGLDIPLVENIIHYHLPETEDAYIHRVGRTARWDADGRNFFLLGPSEQLPDYVEKDTPEFPLDDVPAKIAQPKKGTLYIGKGKQSKISKGDVVGFLCKKGGLKASEIGRIDIKDRYTYVAVPFAKVDNVLKMTSGEKIKGVKTIIEPLSD